MSDPWILAIDTATSVVVVAAGTPAGDLLEARTFPAEHRHGSHLLPTIQGLAADRSLALADLTGVVVGTGPGAFTGLRVGLATAKVLAHELRIPLVGVATSDALLAADPGATALLLPAGPHDRTIVERGAVARLLAGDAMGAGEVADSVESADSADDGAGSSGGAGAARAATGPEPGGAMAVDLVGRASEAAVERGRRALVELPTRLLALGAARLGAGHVDDIERLVPVYVSLPRGVTTEVGEGEVAWSRDPR